LQDHLKEAIQGAVLVVGLALVYIYPSIYRLYTMCGDIDEESSDHRLRQYSMKPGV